MQPGRMTDTVPLGCLHGRWPSGKARQMVRPNIMISMDWDETAQPRSSIDHQGRKEGVAKGIDSADLVRLHRYRNWHFIEGRVILNISTPGFSFLNKTTKLSLLLQQRHRSFLAPL